MQPFSRQIGSALLLLTDLSRADPPPDLALPRMVMASLTPDSGSPLGRAHAAIYAEAFRRLGYQMITVNLPPARASAEAEANRIDGELTRGTLYGGVHPGMVRLDEQVFSATLAAYTVAVEADLSGWNSLRRRDYKVEYRMGIEASRRGVSEAVPAVDRSAVPTTVQGLRKLLARRTDVYIDFDAHVAPQLRQVDLPGNQRIVRIGTMEQLRVHAYLSSKNRALAIRLSAVLKQMKREGVVDAYRRAAEADPARK